MDRPRCIILPGLDPAQNLAIEEVLFNNTEEAVLLWRSKPCVVIGRHQVAHAESDPLWRETHSVPLYRRVSGGGAVYHDEGNVNFTFIRDIGNVRCIDYGAALQPLLHVLQEMGVDARQEGRSDLYIGERKISGNAIRMHRNRLLHHGTLLYSADLGRLREAVASNDERYESRAVQSRPSGVTNIAEALDNPPGVGDFMHDLMRRLIFHLEGRNDSVTEGEVSTAHQIAASRYLLWRWNIGGGPRYTFQSSPIAVDDRPAQSVRLDVRDGRIAAVNLAKGIPADSPFHQLAESLEGERHDPHDVREALLAWQAATEAGGTKLDDMLTALF